MSDAQQRVKVIFIAGQGRSGSTLLDLILGSAPGILSTGEFRVLWSHLDPNSQRRCGCGDLLRACPFWVDVRARAFAADAPDPGHIQGEVRTAIARRNMPFWFLRPWRTRGAEARQARLGALMERVSRAALEVAGAGVLVDSSKIPRYALILAGRPEVDLRVVHLVRDPRGSVRSWRRGRTSGIGGVERSMRRFASWKVAGMWAASHLTTELLRLKRVPLMTVRYEDLVAQPEATVARILAFAGVEATSPAWSGPGEFLLSPQHVFSGNPVRHARGSMAIRLDEEWRSALSTRDKLITVAMTWPLLLWHRYPLWA